MELKIEYIPVDALEPYEKNARQHHDEDIQTIVNSITKFGFDDPIGIWSDHNVIVEGHGRLLAAKQLGMTEVPCIRLDHLTDAERRAYALAHNRTAELSVWDDDLLELELDELVLEDIDMSEFGFNTDSDVFDESDLDSTEEKENVIVSVNCGSQGNYESIKERIENLADEIGGKVSVKMG